MTPLWTHVPRHLWALGHLLDQKLPDDRIVNTFLIVAASARSVAGPGPRGSQSVSEEMMRLEISRCECVHM